MKVMIVATIELPEGADALSYGDTVGTALDAAGVQGEATITVIREGQSLGKQMPGVFSDPKATTPTIPYQAGAKLVVAQGGQYMDVLGDDGNVLASFERPDVRRVFLDMH